MRNSFRNSLALIGIASIVSMISWGLISQLLTHSLSQETISFLQACLLGVTVWAGFLYGGGQSWIQHLALRITLYKKHRIPWNYARFLDYAAQRLFLQKVGGGYIFIHRMLLEHFAELNLETKTQRR